MAGINKVILIGNLGRDPEVRYTQGGTAVANLAVATSRKFKRGEEWVDEVEWHRITVWGKAAENCCKYLAKGRQVYVEGRLKTSSYDKDGQKHYSTDIVAETVQFLSSNKDASNGNNGGNNGNRPPEQNPQELPPAPENGSSPMDPIAPSSPGDDDIPF